MVENLVQRHRDDTVACRPRERTGAEFWFVALTAGACLSAALERRSPAGLLLALAGGTIAWWGFGPVRQRHVAT
jgi:hypothetical protein